MLGLVKDMGQDKTKWGLRRGRMKRGKARGLPPFLCIHPGLLHKQDKRRQREAMCPSQCSNITSGSLRMEKTGSHCHNKRQWSERGEISYVYCETYNTVPLVPCEYHQKTNWKLRRALSIIQEDEVWVTHGPPDYPFQLFFLSPYKQGKQASQEADA